MSDRVPEWIECLQASQAGTATALHRYVLNWEPAGREDEEDFRSDLQAVLAEATAPLREERTRIETNWTKVYKEMLGSLEACVAERDAAREAEDRAEHETGKAYTERDAFKAQLDKVVMENEMHKAALANYDGLVAALMADGRRLRGVLEELSTSRITLPQYRLIRNALLHPIEKE
jgi:hypothetical protein